MRLQSTRTPASLFALFASQYYAVHPLDVIRGPPVDVAIGIPVLTVVVVDRRHRSAAPLIGPMRQRWPRRRRFLLPPAGDLLLAAEQRCKKGALTSPHRHCTTLYIRPLSPFSKPSYTRISLLVSVMGIRPHLVYL
jgi:hypothetical protein